MWRPPAWVDASHPPTPCNANASGVRNCLPLGFPHFARGTVRVRFPPLCEGNRAWRTRSVLLQEGFSIAVFCEVWFHDWHKVDL
jgi:hypothetical protein